MTNPFDVLDNRLSVIENLLVKIQTAATARPTPAPNEDEYLYIEDFANEFKIAVPTIRRHAKRIGYSKFGRRLMFRRSDILIWLDSKKVKGRVQIQNEAIERLKGRQ